MSPTIGVFTTPRVIRSVVSTASGPDLRKYVLLGLAGDTSAGYLSLVMTLASAEACFQPDVATYLYNCYILSVEYVASLALPDVKNTSSYPFVDTQNIFFVFVGVLFAGPAFFQVSFPSLSSLSR